MMVLALNSYLIFKQGVLWGNDNSRWHRNGGRGHTIGAVSVADIEIEDVIMAFATVDDTMACLGCCHYS